jgi:hypothetical protein
MASYFVASRVPGDGPFTVHDRSRCPPGAFPARGAEYLGEFLDADQALAVARLRYPDVAPCTCCAATAAAVRAGDVLTILRS